MINPTLFNTEWIKIVTKNNIVWELLEVGVRSPWNWLHKKCQVGDHLYKCSRWFVLSFFLIFKMVEYMIDSILLIHNFCMGALQPRGLITFKIFLGQTAWSFLRHKQTNKILELYWNYIINVELWNFKTITILDSQDIMEALNHFSIFQVIFTVKIYMLFWTIYELEIRKPILKH